MEPEREKRGELGRRFRDSALSVTNYVRYPTVPLEREYQNPRVESKNSEINSGHPSNNNNNRLSALNPNSRIVV